MQYVSRVDIVQLQETRTKKVLRKEPSLFCVLSLHIYQIILDQHSVPFFFLLSTPLTTWCWREMEEREGTDRNGPKGQASLLFLLSAVYTYNTCTHHAGTYSVPGINSYKKTMKNRWRIPPMSQPHVFTNLCTEYKYSVYRTVYTGHVTYSTYLHPPTFRGYLQWNRKRFAASCYELGHVYMSTR